MSVDRAEEIFEKIEATRDDERACKEQCWKLVKVLGDGKGDRAEFVQQTLDLIRSFRSTEYFAPALLNATISALGDALWEFEELVEQLPEVDKDSVELLLDVSDRGLRNVAARLPLLADKVRNDPSRERDVLNKYASPYRNICRLLMGLLRLRDVDEFSRLSSAHRRLGRMARYIRRIDAQLADVDEVDIDRVFLSDMLDANADIADRPSKLARVSRLGYQTGYFLLGAAPPLAELDQ
jgi:Asp-tRNA(Asn)/Glu-tRNA(Gln) amidotransferase C subunit